MNNKNYKYRFADSPMATLFPILFTVPFIIAAVLLYRANNFFYIPVSFFGLIILFAVVAGMMNKIFIYDDGFLHQRFFKKTYYKDCQIEKAWIYDRLVAGGNMQHFFCYTTKEGKTVKYAFRPSLYDYADYLVQRISGEDVTEYEEYLDNE